MVNKDSRGRFGPWLTISRSCPQSRIDTNQTPGVRLFRYPIPAQTPQEMHLHARANSISSRGPTFSALLGPGIRLPRVTLIRATNAWAETGTEYWRPFARTRCIQAIVFPRQLRLKVENYRRAPTSINKWLARPKKIFVLFSRMMVLPLRSTQFTELKITDCFRNSILITTLV